MYLLNIIMDINNIWEVLKWKIRRPIKIIMAKIQEQ